MFLRIAFLFFILNHILSTIPSIAKDITGASVPLEGPDKDVDPFVLARKVKDLAGTTQRIFKYGGISLLKKGEAFGKRFLDKKDDRESNGSDSIGMPEIGGNSGTTGMPEISKTDK